MQLQMMLKREKNKDKKKCLKSWCDYLETRAFGEWIVIWMLQLACDK